MSFHIPVRVSRKGMKKLMSAISRSQNKERTKLEIQYACEDGTALDVPYLPFQHTEIDHTSVQFDFPASVVFKEGGITQTPSGIEYLVHLQILSDDLGCSVKVTTTRENKPYNSNTIGWDNNRLVEITAKSYKILLEQYNLATYGLKDVPSTSR